MELTVKERAFIERRAQLARLWPIVGAVALAGVGGLLVWLWTSHSLLIDPGAVMSRVEEGSIPESTASLMMMLLPLMVLTCLMLMLALLVFVSVAIANEKKHIAVIRRLLEEVGKPNESAFDAVS